MKLKIFISLLFITVCIESWADVWNGDSDKSWYNSGEKEFIITNSAQFKGLADLVNNDGITFENCLIRLNGNIDLNNIQWQPIGYGNPNFGGTEFHGQFIGNDHVVKNLYIDCNQLPYTNYTGVGLFGNFYGEMSGISLSGTILVNNENYSNNNAIYIGGLCGIGSGTIQSCTVNIDMNVTISNTFMVFSLVAGKAKSIKQVKVDGFLNNQSSYYGCFGTLAGYAEEIDQCSVSANIQSMSSNSTNFSRFGGAVGSTTSIHNTIFEGELNIFGNGGNGTISGIAGGCNEIKNVIFAPSEAYISVTFKESWLHDLCIGSICSKFDTNESLVESSYYTNNLNVTSQKGSEISLDDLTSGQVLEGFDTNIWQFEKGSLPSLKTLPVESLPILTENIVLDKQSVDMKVGESTIINATILPENATDKSIIWTSSDESVAIVNQDGSVSSLKIGETDITATATDESKVNAVCHVRVIPTLVESVKLSPDNWRGSEGETFKIEATVLPENASNKTFVWSSSNVSVAIVDSEGNVSAIKAGEADITASALDGSGISAICHITVLPVLVELISLTPTDWSGFEGESFKINASVFPENASNKTFVWSSSNISVAIVDAEGNVSAIKAGEAEIMASALDGSGAIATCHVTVNPVLVELISLNPDNWNGEEGDSFKIEATVYPDNATNKSLEWNSSDNSIAVVDNYGNVSVLSEGICVIVASAIDGSGVYAECRVTGLAGIDVIFTKEDGGFYVYDINGLLLKKDCRKENLNMLTPGIYIIQQGKKSVKLVIRQGD